LILHGIEHCQTGHDLAGGEDLDLESAIGDFCDALGEHFTGTVKRVKRLRPTRSEPPSDLWHRLGNGRHSDRTDSSTDHGCG
jgi:hypothetical protein